MAGPTEFDPVKALEAILYVAERAGTSLYGTLKLLYVADKFHLERYGRLIFGEDYSAMQWGPVPSHAYDIVKAVRNDQDQDATRAFAMKGDAFELKRPADIEELSETDRECLDEAIETYGNLDFNGFKRLTHDSAWDAAWNSPTRRAGSVPIPIASIASQMPNAQRLVQYLSDPHPGEA